MDWFIIIVYLITCFGISTILIDAVGPWHIFDKWHTWMHSHTPMLDELFSCYICFPTWLGLFFSALNILLLPSLAITPFNILMGGIAPWWLIIPLDGAFTSGAIWFMHTIQSAIEKYADE